MSNDLMRKKSKNILTAINSLVSDIGLNDVKTTFDSKTGIASVIGNKDGFQYTTTLTKHMNGIVQTTTQFGTNLGKEALISQIKDLRKQGFKQQQIADMLKISQATVSKYLRK
ncbi:helix-turn-helix domain-containing protein [[Clostridium] hylemonae]|uniref:helix-turn-helix domain-containing protein n=1 Tax=[Clostridium] hylemonae TaxID=89153 RepID=UPI001D0964E0|nr:helix-turn-helix domain-containing protein [[Clostridium] hylemonae]MCB7521903.1 helix-turn-helix domain-containing protein [[Clostridium] hylemonae]